MFFVNTVLKLQNMSYSHKINDLEQGLNMPVASPSMFSDEEEDRPPKPLQHGGMVSERELLGKLKVLLSGIPPPPALATCKLSLKEILNKLESNKHLLSLPILPNPVVDDTPKVFFLNSGPDSEEIATLMLKYQARYVQSETQSTCTALLSTLLPKAASVNNRISQASQGVSPGRRLSHLARRRQVFSRANLPKLHQNDRLEIKARLVRQRQLAKDYTDKRLHPALPKRALFQSPDDEIVRPGFKTVARQIPRRQLFANAEKKVQPLSPPQAGDGRYDVSGWIAAQNFEGGKKRMRDEDRDSDKKRKCPRRSLDFSDSSPSRCSEASTFSSVSQQPLSTIHKKKLLWAVSMALKEKNISHRDTLFKPCATMLFNICRKNWTTIRNLPIAGGTSEKILHFAQQEVLSIISQEQSKLGVFQDLSDSKLNSQRMERTKREVFAGKENATAPVTPKKTVIARPWRSCLKSKRKIQRRLQRTRSCDGIFTDKEVENVNFQQTFSNDRLNLENCKSVVRKLYIEENASLLNEDNKVSPSHVGNQSVTNNFSTGITTDFRNVSLCLGTRAISGGTVKLGRDVVENNSLGSALLVSETPEKSAVVTCAGGNVQETPEKDAVDENFIMGSMEDKDIIMFPALSQYKTASEIADINLLDCKAGPTTDKSNQDFLNDVEERNEMDRYDIVHTFPALSPEEYSCQIVPTSTLSTKLHQNDETYSNVLSDTGDTDFFNSKLLDIPIPSAIFELSSTTEFPSCFLNCTNNEDISSMVNEYNSSTVEESLFNAVPNYELREELTNMGDESLCSGMVKEDINDTSEIYEENTYIGDEETSSNENIPENSFDEPLESNFGEQSICRYKSGDSCSAPEKNNFTEGASFKENALREKLMELVTSCFDKHTRVVGDDSSNGLISKLEVNEINQESAYVEKENNNITINDSTENIFEVLTEPCFDEQNCIGVGNHCNDVVVNEFNQENTFPKKEGNTIPIENLTENILEERTESDFDRKNCVGVVNHCNGIDVDKINGISIFSEEYNKIPFENSTKNIFEAPSESFFSDQNSKNVDMNSLVSKGGDYETNHEISKEGKHITPIKRIAEKINEEPLGFCLDEESRTHVDNYSTILAPKGKDNENDQGAADYIQNDTVSENFVELSASLQGESSLKEKGVTECSEVVVNEKKMDDFTVSCIEVTSNINNEPSLRSSVEDVGDTKCPALVDEVNKIKVNSFSVTCAKEDNNIINISQVKGEAELGTAVKDSIQNLKFQVGNVSDLRTSTPLNSTEKKFVIKSKPTWKVEAGPGLRMRLSKEYVVGRGTPSDAADTSENDSFSLEESAITREEDSALNVEASEEYVKDEKKVNESYTSTESYNLDEIRVRMAIEKTLANEPSEEVETSEENISKTFSKDIISSYSEINEFEGKLVNMVGRNNHSDDAVDCSEYFKEKLPFQFSINSSNGIIENLTTERRHTEMSSQVLTCQDAAPVPSEPFPMKENEVPQQLGSARSQTNRKEDLPDCEYEKKQFGKGNNSFSANKQITGESSPKLSSSLLKDELGTLHCIALSQKGSPGENDVTATQRCEVNSIKFSGINNIGTSFNEVTPAKNSLRPSLSDLELLNEEDDIPLARLSAKKKLTTLFPAVRSKFPLTQKEHQRNNRVDLSERDSSILDVQVLRHRSPSTPEPDDEDVPLAFLSSKKEIEPSYSAEKQKHHHTWSISDNLPLCQVIRCSSDSGVEPLENKVKKSKTSATPNQNFPCLDSSDDDLPLIAMADSPSVRTLMNSPSMSKNRSKRSLRRQKQKVNHASTDSKSHKTSVVTDSSDETVTFPLSDIERVPSGILRASSTVDNSSIRSMQQTKGTIQTSTMVHSEERADQVHSKNSGSSTVCKRYLSKNEIPHDAQIKTPVEKSVRMGILERLSSERQRALLSLETLSPLSSTFSSGEKSVNTPRKMRKLSLECYKARKKLELTDDESSKEKPIYNIRLKSRPGSSEKKRKHHHSERPKNPEGSNSCEKLGNDSSRDPRRRTLKLLDGESRVDVQNIEVRTPKVLEVLTRQSSHNSKNKNIIGSGCPNQEEITKALRETTEVVLNSVNNISLIVEQRIQYEIANCKDSEVRRRKLNKLAKAHHESHSLMKAIESNPERLIYSAIKVQQALEM